jgi:hypothetical protein
MTYGAAPSYLPFADNSADVFAVHLWPGRPLEESPIVQLPHDGDEIHFICKDITGFPSALLLRIGQYFGSKRDIFKKAMDQMTKSIPNAKPITDEFWVLFDKMDKEDLCGYWYYEEYTPELEQAWLLPAIGHPYAGVPRFDREAEAKDVLPILEEFVRKNPQPELMSLLLATQIKAGVSLKQEDLLALLSAEAWRETESLSNGDWKVYGYNAGMGSWNTVFCKLPNPEELLKGTPFEPLIGKPKIYGQSRDENSPFILAEIAKAFCDAGDYPNALRQIRNAAKSSFEFADQYPQEFAEETAKICDLIEKDSLAAAIARESARLADAEP